MRLAVSTIVVVLIISLFASASARIQVIQSPEEVATSTTETEVAPQETQPNQDPTANSDPTNSEQPEPVESNGQQEVQTDKPVESNKTACEIKGLTPYVPHKQLSECCIKSRACCDSFLYWQNASHQSTERCRDFVTKCRNFVEARAQATKTDPGGAKFVEADEAVKKCQNETNLPECKKAVIEATSAYKQFESATCADKPNGDPEVQPAGNFTLINCTGMDKWPAWNNRELSRKPHSYEIQTNGESQMIHSPKWKEHENDANVVFNETFHGIHSFSIFFKPPAGPKQVAARNREAGFYSFVTKHKFCCDGKLAPFEMKMEFMNQKKGEAVCYGVFKNCECKSVEVAEEGLRM